MNSGFAARLKSALLQAVYEFFWCWYVFFIFLLASLVRIRREGDRPRRPCVLAVTHISGYGFDPLFVTWASRHFRGFALYSLDRPGRLARLLAHSFWRFGVTQDPQKKKVINPRTIEAAVQFLKKQGSLQVYPEGDRFWERKLYPGAAILAHRAQVPLIPVGLENVPMYEPGVEKLPVWRGVLRALGKTFRKRWVAVHFADPIFPDPSSSEDEDVDRMMRKLEQAFGEFYQKFYGLPGPVWRSEAK
ncbi:MAG: 1-acyl-sn-glycerol-3-phosphate acyltransferase [Candidatus Bipolaricaulota bacterium]|nr:1-acyl-sn-glycerol-3-phosphate acyltransferase [Candidatus Bipolaricaulota bacterium]MDW8126198.1 lysophospholipid acyltransferase family protein [Candidatus Bipolaricaulota bacterium]